MRLVLALLATTGIALGIYFTVAQTNPPQALDTTRDARWRTASPEAEGFAPARFDRAIRRIETDTGSLIALLVARHGRLVYERYYHGYARDSGFDLYSITKSVTSALVGVAISEHRLSGVHETLGEIFGDEAPTRARRLTLQELMTMTTGWPGDADPRNDIGDAPNITRALLRRPLVRRPGSEFRYDTPSSHLLSAVLTRSTGMSEEDYARRHLFRPLHIHLAEYWPKDDQGNTYGGTGLTLYARDAAKIGQLFLQRGRWNRRQLVPRTWVAESTRTHVRLGPPHSGYGYGYDWWTRRRGKLTAYVALGYGGQVVAVSPKLDLVVVAFCSPAGVPVDIDRVLFDELAPAVTRM